MPGWPSFHLAACTVALFSIMVYLQGIATIQQMSFSICHWASLWSLCTQLLCKLPPSIFLVPLFFLSSQEQGLPQLNCPWCSSQRVLWHCSLKALLWMHFNFFLVFFGFTSFLLLLFWLKMWALFSPVSLFILSFLRILPLWLPCSHSWSTECRRTV